MAKIAKFSLWAIGYGLFPYRQRGLYIRYRKFDFTQSEKVASIKRISHGLAGVNALLKYPSPQKAYFELHTPVAQSGI